MFKIKEAFTITELVVALGIIGVIATMTIPHIAKDINRKILSSQIKNTVASLQQVVADEMVTHKTKNLMDTDFGNPDTLLTEEHFEILKECSSTDNCWGEKYGYIHPGKRGDTVTPPAASTRTIKLRNGVVIGYKLISNPAAVGNFYIDINGSDDPNIIGRDFFAIRLMNTGKLLGAYPTGSKCYTSFSLSNGGLACMQSLMDNNWKMPDDDRKY